MLLAVQPDASKLNASTSDTGMLANFFNSLLSKKGTGGGALGPDGKPAGKSVDIETGQTQRYLTLVQTLLWFRLIWTTVLQYQFRLGSFQSRVFGENVNILFRCRLWTDYYLNLADCQLESNLLSGFVILAFSILCKILLLFLHWFYLTYIMSQTPGRFLQNVKLSKRRSIEAIGGHFDHKL